MAGLSRAGFGEETGFGEGSRRGGAGTLRHWRRASLLLALGAGLTLAGCGTPKGPQPSTQSQSGGSGAVSSGGYKIGKPYQVAGQWYYPQEDYTYDETGIASWYGPGFHGQRSANGEVYNQNDLTAAHKTLPMPSLVRVTNLDNGRSIVLRINDRGPFVAGRIIDVSRRAAQLLGMDRTGTAKVRVQILADESRAIKMAAIARNNEDMGAIASAAQNGTPMPSGDSVNQPAAAPRAAVVSQSLGPIGAPTPVAPPPAAVPSAAPARGVLASNNQQPVTEEVSDVPGKVEDGRFLPAEAVQQVPVNPAATRIFVQAGSFTNFDYANRLRARLASLGNVEISPVMVKNVQFFRVRVGPIASVDDADKALARVVASGQNDARVVID
jgi:rare lipoprotein A